MYTVDQSVSSKQHGLSPVLPHRSLCGFGLAPSPFCTCFLRVRQAYASLVGLLRGLHKISYVHCLAQCLAHYVGSSPSSLSGSSPHFFQHPRITSPAPPCQLSTRHRALWGQDMGKFLQPIRLHVVIPNSALTCERIFLVNEPQSLQRESHGHSYPAALTGFP